MGAKDKRLPGEKSRRSSEEKPELVSGKIAIPKDLAKEPRAESLTRVNGNDGSAAVGMAEIVVTALDPNDFEAGLSESCYHFSPTECRQLRHPATVTF